MRCFLIAVLILLSFLFSTSNSSLFVESKDTFTELKENVFSNLQCLPYAYADFNADKRIDIYCVAEAGMQIQIWLAQERDPLFSKHLAFYLSENNTIVSLIPGDFNGDSVIDLLVTYRLNFNKYRMSIFYEKKTSKTTNELGKSIIYRNTPTRNLWSESFIPFFFLL